MLTGRRSRVPAGSHARQPPPAQRARLVPAAARHLGEVESLVARDPVLNVHTGAHFCEARRGSGRRLWVALEGDRLIGALQYHRGFAWVLDRGAPLDERTVRLFASFIAPRCGEPDILVGPENEVDAILAASRHRGMRAMEMRRQVMMSLPHAPASHARPGFSLRPAEHDDIEWLLEAHAAMCLEDLGTDQVSRNREGYRRYFRGLIASRRCFVGTSRGERLFKAEIALQSDDASLIEGVYTERHARGRGYATAAMAALGRHALRRGRCACLYVHRANGSARSVYERVGFETRSPWATAITSRRS